MRDIAVAALMFIVMIQSKRVFGHEDVYGEQKNNSTHC
jgi:hypothetical protein